MYRLALSVLVLLITIPVLVAAVATTDHGVMTLSEYFDLLVSGNLESALYLWTQEDIDRASRFGIEFEGIPLKVDCTSPVIRDLPKMKNYLQPPVRTFSELDPNFNRMEFSQLVDGAMVEHYYYVFFDGEYHWLTHPQNYFAQDWPVSESKYFRLHVDPLGTGVPNDIALATADDFIESLADSLDLSKEDMKNLRQKKIEYFYCHSDSVVMDITGHRIKGTLDLATNDIISAFFPHYHELTHLLVNIKLKRLPLYTQPLMREGIAVYFGGRWGKAAASLLDLACFLYQEQIVDLDSLLTMRDFDANSSADIAYPVAGLFVAYLVDEIGHDKFLDLYRSLSGNFPTVYGMTRVDVKNIIGAALDKADWGMVLDGFKAYQEEATSERAIVAPGTIDGGKELLRGEGYVVRSDKNWLAFEFSGTTDQGVTGNLLFDLETDLASAVSELYIRQYGDSIPFSGYRYGIRFDQNEAGLYDYATNELLAKYIWGISPSDEYYDEAGRTVTLKFRKELFDLKHLQDDKVMLLAY
jgi:hypothetical protein